MGEGWGRGRERVVEVGCRGVGRELPSCSFVFDISCFLYNCYFFGGRVSRSLSISSSCSRALLLSLCLSRSLLLPVITYPCSLFSPPPLYSSLLLSLFLDSRLGFLLFRSLNPAVSKPVLPCIFFLVRRYKAKK